MDKPQEAPRRPDYEEAYTATGAPDLVTEDLELMFLTESIRSRTAQALTGNGPAADHSDYRLYLLRKAAWADRAARELELAWHGGRDSATKANTASATAEEAATLFRIFDLERDPAHAAGPIGAESTAWDADGGARAYVRQEYLAWQSR